MELPEVKPLMWVGNDPERFRSHGGLFTYSILHDGDEPDEWSMHRDAKHLGYYSTEDMARAAAQADYEQRIRSALATPSAPEQEIEGLVERLNDTARTAREINPFHPFNAADAPRLFAALADEAAEAASALTSMAGELRATSVALDLLRGQLKIETTRRRAAEASLAEALKALEPFAMVAHEIDKVHPGWAHHRFVFGDPKFGLTFAAFDEARRLATLSTQKGDHPDAPE